MTTRLWIARHGNTFGPTEEPRRVGITDLPLVESGFLQGQRLGSYLAQHQALPEVIFTSRLQRTIQTATEAQKTMGTELPIQALACFDEIDYGVDENQPESVVQARLGALALKDWDTEAIVPAGWQVDPQAIIQQWWDFTTLLLQTHPDKNCLVVTSNGIARFAPYLTRDFAGFRQMHSIKVATGGLCLFEYIPGLDYWECLEWNIKPT